MLANLTFACVKKKTKFFVARGMGHRLICVFDPVLSVGIKQNWIALETLGILSILLRVRRILC